MAKEALTRAQTDDLLKEIRDRFDVASREWQDIRAEGQIDMRYVSGDPWDPADRQARKDAGRPCLALDELGQYTNQTVNEVRSNPRGMKFSPTGNGASEQGAEFYQNKAREIEYRSHAQVAYTTAFENAVNRSYGFCRIVTKFEGDRSFNQEIWIEDLPNPDLVLPDPDAKKPDSSDMKYCFVYEARDIEEFKKEFPDAEVHDFTSYISDYPQWVKAKTITLAEYWTIKQTAKTLLMIQLPPMQAANAMIPAAAPKPLYVYEDEIDLQHLPPGAKIVAKRQVQVPSVCQYLTNGLEILKTTEWPGKYIPIASCYGKILYVDDGSGTKRKLLSMVRLARDPYMLYCYYRTGQAEQVGMSTKFPFLSYVNQFSQEQKELIARSLHEPVAVLEAKATSEETGNQILPLPVRQIFEPAIQALEMGAEGARRAIQAAMGSSPLPTQAQRHNEKSGVALKQIQQSGQIGTFHFVDHYDGMIRHVAVMIEDLMDKIYDTAREVGVRKPDDQSATVMINNPQSPQSVDTRGDYLTTVSAGPSFESQRDEVGQFTDALVSSPIVAQVAGPKVAAAILSKSVRMKNLGPTGEEIADLLMPPEFKQSPGGKAPMPPEAQHAIGQMQQQLQQVQQAAQQMHQQLESKQLEFQSRERIAAADRDAQDRREGAKLQTQRDIADLESRRRAETAITVAEIGSKNKVPDLYAEERARIGVQEQATADRTHEALQNEQDRQHEAAMADLEHRQALEQAQQGAGLAMDQQAQQAALQPPAVPQNGAGA